MGVGTSHTHSHCERRPDELLCFHACALSSNGELIATIGKSGEPEIHRRIFGQKLDWETKEKTDPRELLRRSEGGPNAL